MLTTEWMSVAGLRALMWVPEQPVAGVVLVEGSGSGRCDEWGGWAERVAALGVVVLAHDKPDDWLAQALDDRVAESVAALTVLRAHPAVIGPVGLMGFSQGGWVGLLAASHADFLVTVSGPGVGVAAQDRYRIGIDLAAAGLPADQIAEALAWIDERAARMLVGEPVDQVLAAQRQHADRPWYPVATRWFDASDALAYLARMLPFEPAPVLPAVDCPVLALFGAADPLVPVAQSVVAYAAGLPRLTGLAVFPGADHGLFVAEPTDGVDRTDQLAPGFLPMLGGFLHSVG